MHTKKSFGSRRHVLTRLVAACALLGSTFLVGLATSASADPSLHLAITTASSTSDASGVALAVQPVVSIEDGSDVVQSSDSSTVTATITDATVGESLTNPTAVASSGVATFSGLAFNATAGPQTITFTDGTDVGIISTTITVTVGLAKKLVFSTAPAAGAIDAVALTPQPVVDVVDSGGNIVTSDSSSTVTAAFTTSGSSLANATKTVVAGVATFSGLAITAPIDTTIAGLTFSDAALTTVATGNIAITGPGAKLVITTAPSITAVNGIPLATQPVVKVEDTAGFVLAGDTSTVTAALVAGNAGSSTTNSTKAAVQGVATFAGLTINAAPGSYNLIFTDGSLASATTAAQTAVSVGAAAKLTITTQPSATAAAGAPLTIQPAVAIDDSGGNLISSNTSVVTAMLTSGSGTVTHNTATAVAGVATFSGLTLNVLAGPYTLTFSDGSLTVTVSGTITVSAGAAGLLVIATQPSSTVANGAALAVQPVIKVEDGGGNLVIGNTSTVTATVTSAAGTVTNNTATVSATTGLATFSGLTLKELLGSYTLTFSDGSLTTAVSTSITVTVGVATKLVVTTQPSVTTASGAAFAQQPVVKVEDSAGNVVTTDGSTVTAALTAGGISVTPPTKVVASGVATFSGLAANALVGTYTLTFTDGTLTPAVSTTFTVTVGAASKLVIATEPSASTATGLVLAQQPVIKAEDSGGNVVTTLTTGAVSASVIAGAGGSLTGGSSANFAAGVATFSGLALSGTPGTSYTLSFSGDALSVNDTVSIHVGLAQSALVVSTVHATYGRTFALKTTGGSGTGALTFTVTNGTATGCSVSGTTLKSTTAGTCVVTATKANDVTYASISSSATTVTFAKLPVPRALRLNFAANASALSGAARNAIVVLVRKLTTHSVVSITGYAQGNAALAHQRAAAAEKYLLQHLRVHVQLHWNTTAASQSVLLTTKSQ